MLRSCVGRFPKFRAAESRHVNKERRQLIKSESHATWSNSISTSSQIEQKDRATIVSNSINTLKLLTTGASLNPTKNSF